MRLRVLFALLCCFAAFQQGFVTADVADGEDDDGKVEEEDAGKAADAVSTTQKDQDEEEEVKALKPSPHAETFILFTKPAKPQELPAGGIVKFLISFLNKGDSDFIVQSVDASFRYPMDYSFFIQNYTAAQYNRAVKPGQESTFDYAFVPSEQYAGRPLGLTVNVNYKGIGENDTLELFQNAVFNETINIVEEETTFNPETGFLYVFFTCIVVLLLFVGQQFLQKLRKKHGMTKRAPVIEMGASKGASDVDLDWIPKEVLNHANKSPRPGSPKNHHSSPKQRKNRPNKNGANSD